jgi:hypothetical protein
MAGLDPAIHVFASWRKNEDVDHRDKRGDDASYGDATWIASSLCSSQ